MRTFRGLKDALNTQLSSAHRIMIIAQVEKIIFKKNGPPPETPYLGGGSVPIPRMAPPREKGNHERF